MSLSLSALAQHSRLSTVLALGVLLTVALFARLQPGLYRPLEHDELLTARLRTGAPYDISMDQLKGEHAFNLGRLARGVPKGFLNGWTPNNHVVNSVLMSVSAFFFGYSEWSLRLPVVIASILLALGGFQWVRLRTNSPWFALLCGLLLIVHPHFCYYGQSARGYVISALLVLAYITLLDFAWSRKTTSVQAASLGLIAGLVLLSAAMFLNVVSMLVTWLIPVNITVAVLLAGHAFQGRVTDVVRDARLQAWVFQAGMTCFAIGLFIAGALGQFVAWTEYLGHLNSVANLATVLRQTLLTILPETWWPLGFFAVAGWILMLRKKSFHWLGAAILLGFVVTVVYCGVTKKLLFPRVLGYVVVFVVLGIAWLWRIWSGANTWRTQLARAALLVSMLVALTDSSMAMIHWEKTRDLTYSDAAEIIRQSIAAHHEEAESVFIPSPWVWGEEMQAYLPVDRRAMQMHEDKRSNALVYLACTHSLERDVFLTQYHDPDRRDREDEVEWVVPATLASNRIYCNRGISIYKLRMKLWRSFEALPVDSPLAIVVWNNMDPNFDLASAVRRQMRQKIIPQELRFRTVSHFPMASVQMFVSGSSELALAKAEVSDLQTKGAGSLYVLTLARAED